MIHTIKMESGVKGKIRYMSSEKLSELLIMAFMIQYLFLPWWADASLKLAHYKSPFVILFFMFFEEIYNGQMCLNDGNAIQIDIHRRLKQMPIIILVKCVVYSTSFFGVFKSHHRCH